MITQITQKAFIKNLESKPEGFYSPDFDCNFKSKSQAKEVWRRANLYLVSKEDFPKFKKSILGI